MTTTHNIYQDNGYPSRIAYLKSVAEDYGVAEDAVFALADLLGPNEDFDGLISEVNELSERMMYEDLDNTERFLGV